MVISGTGWAGTPMGSRSERSTRGRWATKTRHDLQAPGGVLEKHRDSPEVVMRRDAGCCADFEPCGNRHGVVKLLAQVLNP